MLALMAMVILAPLLYLPGYLIIQAFLGQMQSPNPLERHYERTLTGALLNGWLAFTLAELEIFSAWLHILLLLIVCAGAGVVAQRRGRFLLPQSPIGVVAHSTATTMTGRMLLSRYWETSAYTVILIVFAVLVAQPFETILGLRDAGVYASAGFAMARTGGIVQYDPLVAQIAADQHASDPALREAASHAETNMLGVQRSDRYIATRRRAGGFFIHEGDLERGRVVPQGFHMYPVWIGLLTSLLGPRGGLLATGLMGLLGVWSVGMLGRRLAGAWVGVSGSGLLALNGGQVWFSRYSTSETTFQFLCLAGLYAFAVAHNCRTGSQDHSPARAHFAALLTGVAFGQLLLTRIDAILIIAPLLLYLLYIWLSRRWLPLHTMMGASLGALLLQSAIHIITIARAYFFDTAFARLQDFALTALISMPFLTPALRHVYLTRPCSPIGLQPCPPVEGMPPPQSADWNIARIVSELLLVALLLIGLFAVRRWGRLASFERIALGAKRFLLATTALGILLLGAYSYFIRPRIFTPELLMELPRCLTTTQLRTTSPACLTLQGYIGAPIAIPTDIKDQRYAIPLANLVRLGWYLSPIGIVLGVLGFACWWWRGMNRSSWLFLLSGMIACFFWIRQTYGTSDQTYIYILRRYIPLVYPTFCLAIGYALVALAGWLRPSHDSSRWRTVLWCVPSLMLAMALASFEAGTSWRTIYQHVEYEQALTQIGDLANRFDSQDILLFRGGDRNDSGDLVVTPLKYAFDRNAFTIKSPSPDKYAAPLARYFEHWRSQGRQVYLILGPNGGLGLPGLRLERVGEASINLRQLEELERQKPYNIQEFQLGYTIYRLAPAATPQSTEQHTIEIDDYASQIRGFYRPEPLQSTMLAWTKGDALLRIPWPDETTPHTLTIRLAGGVRPATLGHTHACLSFRPELSFWIDDPTLVHEHATFLQLGCFDLDQDLRSYSIVLDPRSIPRPTTGTLLLRIESPTWVPAKTDPAQPDQRSLGVLFGGVTVSR